MLKALQNIPRNTALLLVLLGLFILSPVIGGSENRFVLELMFDAVLIAGVYSAGERLRWWFWALTIVTLSYRWGQVFAGFDGRIDVSALGLTLVWLVAAIALITKRLFQKRDVTVDTIIGAVVTYLLSTIAFALVYEIIEIEQPGSFSGLPEGAANNGALLVQSTFYFSLICMTTVGFGDIVPVSPIAKPVAALEGMFGQLYIAVLVARLVGLHLVSERKE